MADDDAQGLRRVPVRPAAARMATRSERVFRLTTFDHEASRFVPPLPVCRFTLGAAWHQRQEGDGGLAGPRDQVAYVARA